jgi:hypothetical protein
MNELLTLLLVLPCLIAANILLGMAIANIEHEFDKEVLIKGIKKGALIYVSIGILVGVSTLLPDLSVEILGEVFTLYQAVIVSLGAVIAKYAIDDIKKLRQALGIKAHETNVIEDEGVIDVEGGVG